MKTLLFCSQRPSQRDDSVAGFTLTELLVVIVVITLLAATQVTALSRAKPKSQTARCASNMRLWGMATTMYLGDNNDHLPYYARQVASEINQPNVFETFAPYVGKATTTLAQSTVSRAEIRQCPGGNFAAPPFYIGGSWNPTNWNCWIGANFGTYASALNGPFYYGYTGTTLNPPLSVFRIRKPSDALIFMDTDGL